jgi:Icc-related predicted phosphoesterase
MKIVAMSDIHGGYHGRLEDIQVPAGDVLIAAGDLTARGTMGDLEEFAEWMGAFKHPVKLAIAGNHDGVFMRENAKARRVLKAQNIVYLQDEEYMIGGVKFYGSPWTPDYYGWYFMMARNSGSLEATWDAIPDDTNVLITHGPAKGVLDVGMDAVKAGDEKLADRIYRRGIPGLKVHLHGHIHQSHGVAAYGNVEAQHKWRVYNVAVRDDKYIYRWPATEIVL